MPAGAGSRELAEIVQEAVARLDMEALAFMPQPAADAEPVPAITAAAAKIPPTRSAPAARAIAPDLRTDRTPERVVDRVGGSGGRSYRSSFPHV